LDCLQQALRRVQQHRAGRFPIERLVRTYPFKAINEAAADAESGRTIKPVLLL
jgi:aryl-alcohol dehydrogenase